MKYKVLALKWRPATFAELVGQEHVKKTVIHALEQQTLHHAYLFTGTRGVGKTTIARILAKSLNCEKGITSTPCGKCTSCVEINEGRFVDLIEVDAASKTKVDDTRELLDNVQYAPSKGAYKVYLIDEVHMLSTHSFNALLKTLEEPPPHVKFLLATTDPQKIPVTVLSRCLQLNLKRIPETLIASHINDILQKESIEHEDAATEQISIAANGSMRDALSLLDQAIAFGEGKVTAEQVNQMLGNIGDVILCDVFDALLAGDTNGLMTIINDVDTYAPDYSFILGEIITLLHDISVLKATGTLHRITTEQVKERLRSIADRVQPEALQLYYEIALRARRDIELVPRPRHGLEMALLRMNTFTPSTATQKNNSSPKTNTQTRETSSSPTPASPTVTPANTEYQQPEKTATAPPTPPPTTTKPIDSNWTAITSQLNLKGMSKMFADYCTLSSKNENVISLQIAERHSSMHNKGVENKLNKALDDYYGESIHLLIEYKQEDLDSPAVMQQREATQAQTNAESSIEQDPMVNALKDSFNASVIPGSIHVKKSD